LDDLCRWGLLISNTEKTQNEDQQRGGYFLQENGDFDKDFDGDF